MTRALTFEDIFEVMSAASVGDLKVRVTLPADPDIEDPVMRLAIGLNLLLDDLAYRRAEAEAAHEAVREKLERLVGERTKELEGLNQELQTFSYSVAHDLRAPLRHASGYAEILLQEYSDRLDDPGNEKLRRISQACERMGQLINDLLMLSQVTRQEMRIGPVDIAAQARSVMGELGKADPGRRVEFVAPSRLSIIADPSLFHIVLENLLGNAWKFTSTTPAPAIELGVQTRQRELVYFVKDNGAGFDSRFADKLFRPFQRLHTQAEFPGTGIGLATVQRILQRHGGRIWVEAAAGKGATFYFTGGTRNVQQD